MISGFELQSNTFSLCFRVYASYVINNYLCTNNVKQRQINKVFYCSCFYCTSRQTLWHIFQYIQATELNSKIRGTIWNFRIVLKSVGILCNQLISYTNNVKHRQTNEVFYCSCFCCIYEFVLKGFGIYRWNYQLFLLFDLIKHTFMYLFKIFHIIQAKKL